ncbi:hypothetical protein, partial [Vibrio sp. 12-2(3-a)]|uniref:hypothetical protein n=1 Tax=Vibrio sp. 12-2(3-a) TaxID=2591019 RepID=UPI001BB1B828
MRYQTALFTDKFFFRKSDKRVALWSAIPKTGDALPNCAIHRQVFFRKSDKRVALWSAIPKTGDALPNCAIHRQVFLENPTRGSPS